MLKEMVENEGVVYHRIVLILILMEHAQRVSATSWRVRKLNVLILILMEHAQRDD